MDCIAHQAPLSMGFSRQEYWSGMPCPPPGDRPKPGIKPRSPALQVLYHLSHEGSLCFGLGGILVSSGISLESKLFFFLCYFFLGMAQEICWNWLEPSCQGVSSASWVCSWSCSHSTNGTAGTHPWERHGGGLERGARANDTKYICARLCSSYFMYIDSLDPHSSLMRLVLLVSSFDRLENWGPGKISNNLPQLVNRAANI